MTLYQVTREWEYNGYSDSDFYIVTYNDEKDELSRLEVHSTRFATGRGYAGITLMANVPEEIWVKAEAALARLLTGRILHAEEQRIMFPKELQRGDKVVLKVDVRNRPRTVVKSPCSRCDGSGKWINPRNAENKRQCFACQGSGEQTRSKATKGALIVTPAGTRAEVKETFENVSQFGTDYGATLILISEAGTELRTSIRDIRRDQEIPLQEECASIARLVASKRDFYSPFATSTLSAV